MVKQILPEEKQKELNNLVAQILKNMEVLKMENHKRAYENEDTASPELIVPMMDDIGVKGPMTRRAVESYCRRLINEAQWTMGDLQHAAVCFNEGFNAAFSICR